jgi:hypothetical protein
MLWLHDNTRISTNPTRVTRESLFRLRRLLWLEDSYFTCCIESILVCLEQHLAFADLLENIFHFLEMNFHGADFLVFHKVRKLQSSRCHCECPGLPFDILYGFLPRIAHVLVEGIMKRIPYVPLAIDFAELAEGIIYFMHRHVKFPAGLEGLIGNPFPESEKVVSCEVLLLAFASGIDFRLFLEAFREFGHGECSRVVRIIQIVEECNDDDDEETTLNSVFILPECASHR